MEQEKKTEINVGLTKKQIANRILKRKDNIYSLDTVKTLFKCIWKNVQMPWNMERKLIFLDWEH